MPQIANQKEVLDKLSRGYTIKAEKKYYLCPPPKEQQIGRLKSINCQTVNKLFEENLVSQYQDRYLDPIWNDIFHPTKKLKEYVSKFKNWPPQYCRHCGIMLGVSERGRRLCGSCEYDRRHRTFGEIPTNDA